MLVYGAMVLLVLLGLAPGRAGERIRRWVDQSQVKFDVSFLFPVRQWVGKSRCELFAGMSNRSQVRSLECSCRPKFPKSLKTKSNSQLHHHRGGD
jgi:hypothetical protein